MDEKIVIDRDTLKAIVVENRLTILKLLLDKKYTQSELADVLALSKPSVKEHLEILEHAKLIKKEETKRKWKYYDITVKGRFLVKPREVKVMFAFACNLIAFFGVGLFILTRKFFLGTSLMSQSATEVAPMMARSFTEDAIVQTTPIALETATMAGLGNDPSVSLAWFLILGILGMTATFMFGYLLKKQNTIIIRKGEK